MTSNVRPIFGGNFAVTFERSQGPLTLTMSRGALLKLVSQADRALVQQEIQTKLGAQDGIR